MRFYILEGRQPVEKDRFTWAQWMCRANCTVATSNVSGKTVSTVFLGIDHRFIGEGPPVLFDTTVWNEDGDPVDCQRFYTFDEAEENHKLTVDAMGLTGIFNGHLKYAH